MFRALLTLGILISLQAAEDRWVSLRSDGFELFTILPPGPAGGPDRMYLRREKRRGQTPGFSRESKS